MPGTAPSSLPSFQEARRIVETRAATLPPSEAMLAPLLECIGLVLAEDLRADRDFPPFPRSTRDGYAVRAADLVTVPTSVQCVGEIKAGANPAQEPLHVEANQAVQIMTGAPVPSGADAVVMVEYTEQSGDRVIISRSVRPGENVVPTASEAKEGAVMVARGTRVSHTTVAVAAANGRPEIAVHRRPRVAILATGDEVVDINLRPESNQIRNSNSYSLAAQVSMAGGSPVLLPVAPDEADELTLLLGKGLEADLLLITGGVSMGKYDLVEQVLASLEARFHFTGAGIQPGKPVVFGEVVGRNGTTPFFGLPGNPVSTMVTFQLFARPVLDALSGATPQPLPFVQARLKAPLKTKTGLTRFLPGKLDGTFEQPQVELVQWQGSGDLMAVSQANCYIVIPPEREHLAAGDTVALLLF